MPGPGLNAQEDYALHLWREARFRESRHKHQHLQRRSGPCCRNNSDGKQVSKHSLRGLTTIALGSIRDNVAYERS